MRLSASIKDGRIERLRSNWGVVALHVTDPFPEERWQDSGRMFAV